MRGLKLHPDDHRHSPLQISDPIAPPEPPSARLGRLRLIPLNSLGSLRLSRHRNPDQRVIHPGEGVAWKSESGREEYWWWCW